MPADPWAEIGRTDEGLNVRRVDPAHPADFYWARDTLGRCALVLAYRDAIIVDEPRPVLNGIEIIEAPIEEGRKAFVLVLRREEDRELFRHLCDDIVEACRGRSDEKSFLASTIQRAWKWHSLLRGGLNRRLGPEEQLGLVGELLFLERVANRLGSRGALEAWRGPLDEPKDFVFEDRAVEVKARHAGKDAVKISSEHQLQVLEGQNLALAVFTLTPSSADSPQSFTLDSLVARIRQALVDLDPSSEEGFDARLLSAGYAPDHDYSDTWWVQVSETAYSVSEGFPRLQAADLPPGITNVTYWLLLDLCAAFERPIDDVFKD